MNLLEATNFTSTVAAARESLENIAVFIEKYCNKEDAETFLSACDRNNFEMANKLLDKTIEKITGYDSVFTALSMFTEKFSHSIPQLEEQVSSALSEKDKIIVINRYASKMHNIMDKVGD